MPPDGVDVLVVGAGPTGLTLAAELVARGVRCRIVDRLPAPSPRSRALVVHARTLELFQKMGFADELVPRGQRSVKVRWYIGGQPALTVDFNDTGIDDTPYPFMLFVSQAETERCLEAHLNRLGGRVERNLEVTGFDEDGDGVTARFADGTRQRARFIVGCDGAHSVVRHTAGLQFEGAAYPQDFVLGDVRIDWAQPNDTLCIFFAPKGLVALFPLPGDRRWRVVVSGAEPPADDAGEPTLAELQALVESQAGVKMTLSDPVWLARFHLHHRGVDRYRAGRAFVAGDAAHIHSPAGGQGMNTGIQDAYNLAWKLALVVAGKAGETLLDSYHDERLPVGKQLLAFTDRLFAAGTSDNRLLAKARDFLLPRLAPRVLATKARRAVVFRFVSELGVHYRSSAIVSEHGHGFRGGPRAGDRAPDVALDGTSLFQRTRDGRFHLLVFGAEVTLPPRLQSLVETVPLPLDGPAAQRYGVRRPSLYLLRPDGYVSYRAATMDVGELVDHLDRLLG